MTPADLSSVGVNGVRVFISGARIEIAAKDGGFDALASSDDTQLSMSGGVSNAILRAAGPVIAEEASRVAPLGVGEVAVTSGGTLPVKFILHAATVDWQRGIKPTPRTIRLAAENLFRRCEMLQIRKIAVPALGTGGAGFSAGESAKVMLASLADHSRNPTVLEEVVFCVPDDAARSAVLQCIQGDRTPAPPDSVALHGFQESTASPERPTGSTEQRLVDRVMIRFKQSLLRRGKAVTVDVTPPKPAAELQDGDSITRPASEGSRQSHTHLLIGTTRPVVGNRYVLLEEIGRGGMGIVYLCWDTVLKHLVAIKTLQPGLHLSGDKVDALRREAALQMGLVHEGIVRLFHFEPWDKTVGPYIIMEYLSWVSGDRWLAEAGSTGIPVHSVLHVGVRVCEALACAHASNVIHGDIKPSNIFVDPAAERAKIADFGVARVVGTRERHALVTKLVGTPAYMAPEQKKFGGAIGPWTDVYLLAMTLGEFIIGVPPAHPEALDLVGDDELTATVLALRLALSDNPRARPKDATEFAALLRGALAA